MGLSLVDWLVTSASLIGVIAASFATGRREHNEDAPTRFFLAGRRTKWYIAAASIFASNIGTEHFVGQAGLAATSGIAVSIYEWSAVYLLILLGWVFAPVYLKLKVTTIPEYLEKRFDKRCRLWFVMMSMISFVICKIGASLFSGAVVLDVLTGMDVWMSASVILIATALYTTIGGLKAVMITDAVQTVIFLVGGLIGAIYALDIVGGVSGVKETLRERDLPWFWHNLHPVDDKDFPWTGMTFGLVVGVSVYYWCVDQEMTQRVLSVESLDHGQLGCVLAGFLKTLPFLITVLPGVVARVIYERCLASDGVEFAEWCAEGAADMRDTSDSNKAYPLLVLRQFPPGVKGIMVASFLAAMMSSLSSVYNSASTIFTYDVYLRLFHSQDNVTAERIVFVGRCTTVVVTCLSLLWLPVIQSSSKGLYLVTQNALAHLAAPMSALFLMALLWPRANSTGAFTSLVVGSTISIIRLILTVVFEDYCDDFTSDEHGRTVLRTTSRNWFVCMNFNHFVSLLVLLCFLTIIIASYTTPPPDYESIKDCLYVWPQWRGIKQVNTSGTETLIANDTMESRDATARRRSQVANVLALILIVGMTILIGITH